MREKEGKERRDTTRRYDSRRDDRKTGKGEREADICCCFFFPLIFRLPHIVLKECQVYFCHIMVYGRIV